MDIPLKTQIKYLQRRLDEISILKSTLLNGDFEQALRVGHQLKGNALTFGFNEFQEIGQNLELAALNQDLSNSLSEVEKIYNCATQKISILKIKEI